MICKYRGCDKEFTQKKHDQLYCSTKCKRAEADSKRPKRKRKATLCTRCSSPLPDARKGVGLCRDCTVMHRDLEEWKRDMREGTL